MGVNRGLPSNTAKTFREAKSIIPILVLIVALPKCGISTAKVQKKLTIKKR